MDAKPVAGDSALPSERLAFLDGLRGVAILMVIVYHAYARWPDRMPYGDRFAGLPFFAYGSLGVELFFLISGFVILMTLEKCPEFSVFMWRRWLRLFPAMLIATVLILASCSLFRDRPAGPVTPGQIMAGLLFIDPEWLSAVLRIRQGTIEGAFWSLFVEVKFYLIAGWLFFKFGERNMLVGLVAVFAVACSLWFIPPGARGGWLMHEVGSACYFGWFAAGALYYRHSRSGRRVTLLLALCVGMGSAAFEGLAGRENAIAGLAIVLLFSAAVLNPAVQKLCSLRVLTLVGFISYPLYLVHENMMVSMIIQLGQATRFIPALLLPVLPIAAVTTLAGIIACYLEPALRDRLRSSLGRA